MNSAGLLTCGYSIDDLREAIATPRVGPRPSMPEVLPHIQLDQWPPDGLVGRLLARAASLDGVIVRQSRMAHPDSAALALSDDCASGPTEAFIDVPEFCHLHAAPPGGIHLTLPPAILGPAIAGAWAEIHPAARSGCISPYLAVVYAPRDERELAVSLVLVGASWSFARGLF